MRAVFALLLAGCFSPSPHAGAPCGTNRECPDGLECSAQNTCEKPGTTFVDAMPDACPAASCDGDMLLGCGEPIACANGCSPDGTPHCFQLAPSNGLTLDLLDGALADVSLEDLDFDTDDGHISTTDGDDNTTEIRAPGTGVINGIRFEIRDGMGIFAANSWTFPASTDDHDATGANAFVLFAKTTITVASPIDAGGNGTAGGPSATGRNFSTTNGGSCRGKAGRSNSGIGAAFGEGGGGGGGAGGGGDGAPSNQPSPTGVGGASCSSSPTTIPLKGGQGGGDGGQASANGGGGGGGAMALVALESITIASGGAVTAPGAGGLSGTGTAGNGGGGGGGGGAILLEAPIVDVMGAITANGGGGGAPTGGSDGNRGAIASSSAAAGGTFSCVETPGATAVTRRGGAGGSRLAAAVDGTTCTISDATPTVISSQGGGGGGAAGRTHIRRHSGTTTGVQSPTAVVEDVKFE
jgi:hypothetical protein